MARQLTGSAVYFAEIAFYKYCSESIMGHTDRRTQWRLNSVFGFYINSYFRKFSFQFCMFFNKRLIDFFISKHAEDAGRKPGDESVPAEGWYFLKEL